MAGESYSVAYFEHERNLAYQAHDEAALALVDQDAQVIAEAGFGEVVLCMTERDVTLPERTGFFGDMVGVMQSHDLNVALDAWGVAGMRGGEPYSTFDKKKDGDACFHNPRAAELDDRWLKTAAMMPVADLFIDEPEMHCRRHKDDVIPYLRNYTQRAADLGFRNTVCLPANINRIDDFETVASWDTVQVLSTDSYDDNPWEKVTPQNLRHYLAFWSRLVIDRAGAHGKEAQNWIPLFSVRDVTLPMVMLGEYKSAGLKRIGMWAYKAAESTPEVRGPGRVQPGTVWQNALQMLKIDSQQN